MADSDLRGTWFESHSLHYTKISLILYMFIAISFSFFFLIHFLNCLRENVLPNYSNFLNYIFQGTAEADCITTKDELDKLRGELNHFLDTMRDHKDLKSKDEKRMREDITNLKLQMSELEYMSRSKILSTTRKESQGYVNTF